MTSRLEVVDDEVVVGAALGWSGFRLMTTVPASVTTTLYCVSPVPSAGDGGAVARIVELVVARRPT